MGGSLREKLRSIEMKALARMGDQHLGRHFDTSPAVRSNLHGTTQDSKFAAGMQARDSPFPPPGAAKVVDRIEWSASRRAKLQNLGSASQLPEES